jgi:hypothetical protein
MPSETTGADGASVARGMVVTEIATLPAGAVLDEVALARILGRTKRSLQRAVNRGDLPPGFLFLGRRTWTAGAILRRIEARQAAALKALRGRTRGGRKESSRIPPENVKTCV